jgi:hypothetical protein
MFLFLYRFISEINLLKIDLLKHFKENLETLV